MHRPYLGFSVSLSIAVLAAFFAASLQSFSAISFNRGTASFAPYLPQASAAQARMLW